MRQVDTRYGYIHIYIHAIYNVCRQRDRNTERQREEERERKESARKKRIVVFISDGK